MRPLMRRIRALLASDDGSATAEYALVTVAAAVFAIALYSIVSGQSIASALEGLIDRALSLRP
ncbi:DUF4244 domain-containing protein [Kutzneria kofuensis]|nr:DUF4244 domain-containing protein [Kutzneria kofuensis]